MGTGRGPGQGHLAEVESASCSSCAALAPAHYGQLRPVPQWDTSLSTEQSVPCSRPQESSELSKYGRVCFLLHFQSIMNIWGKKMSSSYGLAATGD